MAVNRQASRASADGSRDDWASDYVTTPEGRTIPVRATARRPSWSDLPADVQRRIARACGAPVVAATSAGTGFTPGFASRLDLEGGRRLFVKAASSADDRRHGWGLSDAYREEVRKLTLLPAGVGAPGLLWTIDGPIADERWVVIGLQYVDGRPPRRPWRTAELQLVTAALAEIAPLMAEVPAGLTLGAFADDFAGWPGWLGRVEARDGPSRWLEQVGALAAESVERCSGSGMAHLDLRDDNLLIDTSQRVWICDWNWPLRAAPWVDLICVLASAYGDGLAEETESIVRMHPLTRDVDPRSIDALLANLWLYFTTSMEAPVPAHSPHLRDHQRWYAAATATWLTRRLAAPPDSSAPQEGGAA